MKFNNLPIYALQKITIFLMFCLFAIPLTLKAQPNDCLSDRYQQKVFNNIRVTSDITYGSAQNVIGFNQSLELDFYEPALNEEYLGKRPLVVMFFGGAYILGSKTDADMRAWCDSLAHYGYACASVEYRLDNAVNFALPNQGARAAYRAIQDGRAAIRYLLEDPNGFGFNIDPNHIYTGGESAGAITAIHIAYLEETERPAETYSIGFSPDLGCLDCSGNSYVQPFSIAGVIDLWGATLDLNYLDVAENVPMVIIHGDQDTTIPYDTGPPFGVPLFPTMYGGLPMDADLTAKNICHQFYTYIGEGHVIYGIPSGIVTFPNQYWPPIFAQGHEFLWDKTLQFDAPVPTGELVVCENAPETYTVTANPGSIYCWDVVNGTIVSDLNNEVIVQWNTGIGNLTLTETNCIDVTGAAQTIEVTASACCATVNLDIFFDGFPAQNSWDITDANGNLIDSSPNYSGNTGNSTITENTCLQNGCYTLNFYDALNNGMCPFQSSAVGVSTFITPGTLIVPGSIVGTLSLVATPGLCGNYNLTDAQGNSLASGGGSFGGQQSTIFCINSNLALKSNDGKFNNNLKINKAKTLLNIYPTTATNILNVELQSRSVNNAILRIVDLNGRLIQVQQLATGLSVHKIDVHNLSNGKYILQVISDSNAIESKSFIKI